MEKIDTDYKQRNWKVYQKFSNPFYPEGSFFLRVWSHILGTYPQKTQLDFMQIMCNVNWRLIGLLF